MLPAAAHFVGSQPNSPEAAGTQQCPTHSRKESPEEPGGERRGRGPGASLRWEVGQALTKVRGSLAVVARHVGAAAPISLADAALVQRVGGEKCPVTADGLQGGGGKGCWGRPGHPRWAEGAGGEGALVLQGLTTSHFPDTQTPRTAVSLQEVPSRAGTMSCRWLSLVVQCRSQGLLEMWM